MCNIAIIISTIFAFHCQTWSNILSSHAQMRWNRNQTWKITSPQSSTTIQDGWKIVFLFKIMIWKSLITNHFMTIEHGIESRGREEEVSLNLFWIEYCISASNSNALVVTKNICHTFSFRASQDFISGSWSSGVARPSIIIEEMRNWSSDQSIRLWPSWLHGGLVRMLLCSIIDWTRESL